MSQPINATLIFRRQLVRHSSLNLQQALSASGYFKNFIGCLTYFLRSRGRATISRTYTKTERRMAFSLNRHESSIDKGFRHFWVIDLFFLLREAFSLFRIEKMSKSH